AVAAAPAPAPSQARAPAVPADTLLVPPPEQPAITPTPVVVLPALAGAPQQPRAAVDPGAREAVAALPTLPESSPGESPAVVSLPPIDLPPLPPGPESAPATSPAPRELVMPAPVPLAAPARGRDDAGTVVRADGAGDAGGGLAGKTVRPVQFESEDGLGGLSGNNVETLPAPIETQATTEVDE